MKRLMSLVLVAILLLASCAFAEEVTRYSELQKGSKGNDVTQLQTRLKELGFYSISIDGDYGNGTVNAVKAFEEYNNLEVTGIATAELQAFLFSAEAKGIEIPDIEITSVGLKESYGYYFLRPSLVNHTEYTIDAVTCMIKVYNAANERVGTVGTLTPSDVYRYANSEDYYLDYAICEIDKMNLKPEKKYTTNSSNEIDLYGFDEDLTNTVYIAVTRYITSDGDTIDIPENEQVWYGSNGKIVTIEYENNLKQVGELTFELEEKADSYNLGIDERYISNFFAEVCGLPMGGLYLDYVYEDGLFAGAGLKEGDVVIKIGDVWTFDEDSLLLAKGMVDEQEPTSVIFYRRGERCETEFTLD